MMNTYRYGQPYMLIDDTSHRPKLQTNTVNAKGKLLNGFIYNNTGYTNVTNTYDTYNLLSQTKHDNSTTSTNMMTLNTAFDAQKGNLTSRANSLFATNQSFEYDEQDRLTKWADSPEVILNNTFDTTPDGFIADSGVTLMPNFSNTGMLAVKVTTANLGISKKIVSGASVGDTYRIQLLRTSGDKISVILREQDASGTNFIDMVISTISGPIDQDYKIKTYSDLVIRIIKTDATAFAGTPTFFIDNLNVQKYNPKTQQYDASGKITQNELGTYAYNVSGKPYQNSSINPTPATAAYYQTKPLQTITYNTFKSPVSITEQGVDIMNFTYNDSNQRSTMFYGGLGPKESRRYRKYYSSDGTMEIKQDMFNNNALEIITYIAGDGYSAPMIVKSDGTTQNYLYLHRDYQGSIVAISNDSGTIVEKRLFDPWGAIIKVQDGAGTALTGLTILDRGYTGHEHLQSVGLINMNARLYDPKLHRFLQPDNYVQDPSNTQNYNRYGYVLNNPLKYIDPSGESYDDDDDDPTLGWDYEDGTEWIDKYGRWIYNREFQTWIGKDGASDIFNAIALQDVLISKVSINGNYGSGTFNDGSQSQYSTSMLSLDNNHYVESSQYDVTGAVLTTAATAATAGETIMFNTETWYSIKQMKTYSQSFNGNGYTGGKIASGLKISNGLKYGGRAIGAYNAWSIYDQYNNHEINATSAIIEESSNAYSVFGGTYGAAWGVGWEGGRFITTRDFYQNWKQESWLPWRLENWGY